MLLRPRLRRPHDGRHLLLGTSRQAQLIDERLLSKLGPEEYERRLLRCGDSYGFQGDERDVVFISVVSDGEGAPFTSRRFEQRINVAASRARDQMWVFHSVRPHRLHPEDQRAALIRYAADGQRSTDLARDLEARCDSDFERRLLRMLLARGYLVTPQHPVGNLRIDLVVRGGGHRLAIECDGDRFHGPDQWEDDLRRRPSWNGSGGGSGASAPAPSTGIPKPPRPRCGLCSNRSASHPNRVPRRKGLRMLLPADPISIIWDRTMRSRA